MQSKTKWITGGALAVAVIGGGTGMAVAASSGDDEEPLTGSTLDRAVDAALAETGGGTVTETEAGDDGAAYSVEVRLDDGSQVEVNLDENFNVVGQEADDDGPDDDEGENEDEGENDD
jgi:uncharacterized membrane protein YkoI